MSKKKTSNRREAEKKATQKLKHARAETQPDPPAPETEVQPPETTENPLESDDPTSIPDGPI